MLFDDVAVVSPLVVPSATVGTEMRVLCVVNSEPPLAGSRTEKQKPIISPQRFMPSAWVGMDTGRGYIVFMMVVCFCDCSLRFFYGRQVKPAGRNLSIR